MTASAACSKSGGEPLNGNPAPGPLQHFKIVEVVPNGQRLGRLHTQATSKLRHDRAFGDSSRQDLQPN